MADGTRNRQCTSRSSYLHTMLELQLRCVLLSAASDRRTWLHLKLRARSGLLIYDASGGTAPSKRQAKPKGARS